MPDIRRLELEPDDHVDWACEELIQRAFGFEGSIITNESTLDHFEGLDEDAYPGHELVRLGGIPPKDWPLYESELGPDFLDDEDLYIWYPPPDAGREGRSLAASAAAPAGARGGGIRADRARIS